MIIPLDISTPRN